MSQGAIFERVLTRPQAGRVQRHGAQRGFTMIELLVGLAAAAGIAAVVTSNKTISEVEDSLAQGTAEYLMILREGVLSYQQQNFLALSNGTAVAGVANALSPTVAELMAAGMLNASTPLTGPLGFVPVIELTRTNCPGTTCLVQAVVRTPGSFVSPRTGNTPRYDLAATAMGFMRGTGGMSFQSDPNVIRGPAFNVANPIASNPGAILATASYLNTNFFNQFVRMNDIRDPNLQNNLTVGGDLRINGASTLVGNTTVGGSLNVATTINAGGAITSQQQVGAGNNGTCNRAELLQDGRIIARSDCAGTNEFQVNPNNATLTLREGGSGNGLSYNQFFDATLRLFGNGGARTKVALGNAVAPPPGLAVPSVFGDTLTPAAHPNASMGGSALVHNRSNVATVQIYGNGNGSDGGLLRVLGPNGVIGFEADSSTGRMQSFSLRMHGRAPLGGDCSSADVNGQTQEGLIMTEGDPAAGGAAARVGSLVMCRNGRWRPVGMPAAAQDGACAVDGVSGQDADGRIYICRSNGATLTWQSLSNRVVRNVLMGRYLAQDGWDIPKPACPAGAAASIVLVPADTGADYALAPPRNRFEARAADLGATWRASLKLVDQNGSAYSASFAGTPYDFRALAHTYCDFAS